jgi:CHAT domain-containing protein
MNLQAEMAVLSACNTGVGNFELDKGVISLHRAFTQAGVPTTVSSLWEAPDDATQKIMVEFYKQLKSGKTKGRALQLAKINYLKTTKNKELKAPFYWAGFVINGNNNPVMVDNSTFNTTNIVIFIAICILILLAIVFYKKQKWRQSSL